MSKDPATSNLISVNFRLSHEQVRQLKLLGKVYGNRTRAMSEALARLYQSTRAENPAFAKMVAEESPNAADEEVDEEIDGEY